MTDKQITDRQITDKQMTDKQITSPKHPDIELFEVLIGLLATS